MNFSSNTVIGLEKVLNQLFNSYDYLYKLKNVLNLLREIKMKKEETKIINYYKDNNQSQYNHLNNIKNQDKKLVF